MSVRGLVVTVFGLAAGIAPFAPTAAAGEGGQAKTAGVIEICVHRSSGAIRIVDSPRDCRSSEEFQRWNVRGPAGDPGAPGTPGTPGAPGAPGAAGAPGRDGKDATCDPVTPSPIRAVIGHALFESSNAPSFEADVLGFSGGVANSVTIGGATGDAEVGKLSFEDFTVQKLVDAVSPKLFMRAAMGLHFAKVTVQIFRAGTVIPELTYTLKTAFITEIKSNATTVAPGEDVKLVAGELDILFEPEGGTAVQFCWSRITNSACANP